MIVLLSVFPLASQTVVTSRLPAPNHRTHQPDLFTLRLRISSNFDDNALYDNANRRSRTFTTMEPRLTLNFSQPRLKWNANYRPGLALNYGLSTYTSASHLLESNLSYNLTKRLKIGI